MPLNNPTKVPPFRFLLLMTESVLEVKNLTYKVPVTAKDKISATYKYRYGHKEFDPDKNPKYKTILNNVNLKVNSGELVAVIGASGSGKTSLINLIANRVYTKTYSGQINILGKKSGPWIKQNIGYVMQEDMLYPVDTARDSIDFVAKLRLKSKSTKEIVERVIQGVDLGKVADNRVGNAAGASFEAGYAKEGLSGGERRRVSIGREIVSGGKLLLLDECTSGLDIHTANSIIQLLYDLSRKPYDYFNNENSDNENLAVVCSLHQPSSLMWNLFDRVIVMSHGEVVYNSSTVHFQKHLQELNETMPEMYNPADFLIEYITGPDRVEHCARLQQITKQQQFEDMQTKFNTTNMSQVLNVTSNKRQMMFEQQMLNNAPKTCIVVKQKQVVEDSVEIMSISPPNSNSAPALDDQHGANDVVNGGEQPETYAKQKYNAMRYNAKNNVCNYLFRSIYELLNPTAKYAHNYFYQYALLLKRHFTHHLKQPALIVRFLMQYTITGLFCGSLYFRVKHTFTNTATLVGALFYAQMMVSFPVAGEISVRMFQARQGYFREHASGTYGTAPFLISQLTVDFPIYLTFVIYLATLTYWMVGFNDDFTRFVLYCVILLFTLYSVLAMSLFFSFMFKSFVTANVFQMIIMGIFIVFAGPYINSNLIPAYWRWMPWVSVFSYAFRALMYIVFADQAITCDMEQACPDIFEYYGMGGFSLTGSVFLAVGYMAGWIFGFMLLSYLLLRYRRFQ